MPSLNPLFFKCLWLKIIGILTWHIWRWHVVNSFTCPKLHHQSQARLILQRFVAIFVVEENDTFPLEVNDRKMDFFLFSAIQVQTPSEF